MVWGWEGRKRTRNSLGPVPKNRYSFTPVLQQQWFLDVVQKQAAAVGTWLALSGVWVPWAVQESATRSSP